MKWYQWYAGHKIAIAILSISALLFASLFLRAWLQLRAIERLKSETLREEEAVVIPAATPGMEPEVIPIEEPRFDYIEVVESCGPYFDGECLNARSGPGLDFPVVVKLRKGIVLQVGGLVERNGMRWYKVVFNETIRYPERLKTDLYVAADYVEPLKAAGLKDLPPGKHIATNKRIVVSRSQQMLWAYEGDTLVMEEKISTGVELTPTPAGTFTIYRKTPTRYMQGPIPGLSPKYWDLPGVPWNLYFTKQGAVIHGAYWHDRFGQPASNGCVNLPPEAAKRLYAWADLGTRVIIE